MGHRVGFFARPNGVNFFEGVVAQLFRWVIVYLEHFTAPPHQANVFWGATGLYPNRVRPRRYVRRAGTLYVPLGVAWILAGLTPRLIGQFFPIPWA